MKRFIKSILNRKNKNRIFVFVLIFISLFSIFPIGSMRSNTLIEESSEYIALVAKNHTKNGKYLGLMVEPKDSSDKRINNPYFEFLSLYGIYREKMATFIGSLNADKSHSIRLKEIDKDINFSFLNVETGFGVEEYYKDSQNNIIYKQEFYPLELMFYTKNPMVPDMFSFMYISQSNANDLLDKKGLAHTRENYETLLNTLVTLEIDGADYKYAISDIYLEHNYFYEALNEVLGNFLLGGPKYPDGMKRQALYFLNSYSYQNFFFINYALNLYSVNEFDYKLLTLNLEKGYCLDFKKIVFDRESGSKIMPILFLVISLIVLCGAFLLIYFGTYEFRFLNNLFFCADLFLPYIFFLILYSITKSVIFFSYFSAVSSMIIIFCAILAYIVIFLLKKYRKQI